MAGLVWWLLLLVLLVAGAWIRRREDFWRRRMEMAERQRRADIVNCYRRQRHRFSNQLQILSGWSELGRMENLRPFLSELTRQMVEEGRLLSLGDEDFNQELIFGFLEAEGLGLRIDIESVGELPAKIRMVSEARPGLVSFFRMAAWERCERISLRVVVQDQEVFLAFRPEGALPELWTAELDKVNKSWRLVNGEIQWPVQFLDQTG